MHGELVRRQIVSAQLVRTTNMVPKRGPEDKEAMTDPAANLGQLREQGLLESAAALGPLPLAQPLFTDSRLGAGKCSMTSSITAGVTFTPLLFVWKGACDIVSPSNSRQIRKRELPGPETSMSSKGSARPGNKASPINRQNEQRFYAELAAHRRLNSSIRGCVLNAQYLGAFFVGGRGAEGSHDAPQRQ